MPQASVKVWAALAAVYVFWGSTYLGIAVAIKTVPPFLMASVRFLIAGGLLYAWCRWRGSGSGLGWPQVGAALAVGAGLAIGNGGVVWGEQYIPTGVTSIVVATAPFWMVLMARIAFREKVRPLVWIGLVTGFAGLVFLVMPTAGGSLKVAGVVALIVAAIGWAAGSVFSRAVPLPSNPLLSTAAQMVAMSIVLGATALVTGEPARVHLQSISPQSAAAFLYLIVFGSLVGFTSYIWLLRQAPISMVSTYAYVNPVIAVALGLLVLNEQVSIRTLAAGAVTLVGVALILFGRSRPPRPEAPASA